MAIIARSLWGGGLREGSDGVRAKPAIAGAFLPCASNRATLAPESDLSRLARPGCVDQGTATERRSNGTHDKEN